MSTNAKKAQEKSIKFLNKKPIKEKENKAEEYDSDSSDEEMLVRTGNIPSEWYNSYQHVGYDIQSKRVAKEKKDDEIEKFIKQANDKNWWRSIYDPKNNRTMYLSDKDLALINRIRKNYYPTKSVGNNEYFEEDIPYQIHPLNNHIPSKRSFELSKNERKTINRLIYMYKNGLMSLEPLSNKEEKTYDIWEFEDKNTLTDHPSVGFKAPKRPLPETEESYNPPNMPKKEEAVLRKVPMYPKLFDEELDRCSDLFLSARVIKKKIDIKESDLLPDLPKPEELRPFPTKETIIYQGHQSSIRAITTDLNGNVLISSDNGGFIHFYDIMSAKIICRLDVKEKINQILPNPQMNLIVICCETQIYFMIPKYLNKKTRDALLETVNTKIVPLIMHNIQQHQQQQTQTEQKEEVTVNDAFIWKIPKPNSKKAKNGIVFYMKWIQGKVNKFAWHIKGDYFSTLTKNSQGKTQVFIHSLSKMTHQSPFTKIKGNVNSMSFHPNKPYFIVATNTNLFIYNLQKQELIRKFISNLGTIANIAVHNSGSDIIAGAKDGKVAWFQLELSNKPFKQMDYHQDKIKSVSFHHSFPLFFSASRNGKLLVYHCRGTEDELTDPLIVPLKVLKPTHTQNNQYTCAAFHPKQPWIFSGGEDGLIRLWS